MNATPLTHDRIRTAAHQLAAMLNAGRFEALTPDERCDLRGLTVEMLGWADEVYEMEVPRGRIVSLRPAMALVEGGRG